jgi:hypothetical protein
MAVRGETGIINAQHLSVERQKSLILGWTLATEPKREGLSALRAVVAGSSVLSLRSGRTLDSKPEKQLPYISTT